jgi:hypothetical protein
MKTFAQLIATTLLKDETSGEYFSGVLGLMNAIQKCPDIQGKLN